MDRRIVDNGAGTFAHLSPAARALLERQAASRVAHATEEAAVPRAGWDEQASPLTFAQRRVWFFEQITPGTPTYNRPKRMHLDGALDVSALRRAIREIFRRHEVLRSAIDVVEGVPSQRVLSLRSDYLEIVDLSSAPDMERSWLQAADAEALRPFDLASGPLARFTLLRLTADRHVLLFTASHLAFDGWSTGILCTELGEFYRAFVAERESTLSAIPRQYRELAAREASHQRVNELDRDIAYWKEALRGALPVVRLPTESCAPGLSDTVLVSPSVLLPPDLIAALKIVSRQADTTLFMTMFAAFGVMVARLSGMNDIVIGVPVAGRLTPDTERLIGFFANTIPVRMRISAGTTFRSLLAQVRQSTLAALEHQELPFDVLVEHLKPERSLEHAPIVQTLFNFRNFSASPLDMGDVRSRVENVFTGASALELGFDLEERPDGVLCVAEFDRETLTASTVDRWLSHYRSLLKGVTESPDEDVARLPLLTEAERERILVEWNSVSTPVRDDTLHGLVEQQVRRTPDAIAVMSEAGELTYAELNGRANRLAHELASRGVGPDVLVGVSLERSPDLVVALLAVLKAGGAYVPLDPGYPAARVAFMLADAAPAVLVTSAPVASRLPTHAGQTIHIDSDYWNSPIQASDLDNPALRCTPDSLAYVIYTSGSTGRPKGAMNTHRNVCNFVLASCRVHQIGASDVILNKTPVSFDVSVWEIFGSLTTGASLVIARPGGHTDPTYLCDVISAHRVTAVNFVPSMLQALLDVPSAPSQCATLRIVVSGGEALTPVLRERVLGLLPATLHNAYGPTETAVNVCDWRCDRGTSRPTVPLGRPLPNVRIYVLDEQGEPAPIGVVGELYVGGAAVGRGYLNRPELTAERFVADRFSSEPRDRLYRTGDLACFGPDGVIEYLGRRDHQLKLRGVRVELGEIESALLAHDDVREAIVIARPHEQNDVRLIAYVVASDGATLSDRILRAHLRKSLLEQMVPAAFVILDAFPLTPSGKTDRDALPAAAVPEPIANEYVAPRTSTEDAISRVWMDVLGCERVGVHDNFFELGGHSLMAMRVVSRLKTNGMRLAVSAIFVSPTVAQLAALADSQRQAPPGGPAQTEIRRVSRDGYRRAARVADQDRTGS